MGKKKQGSISKVMIIRLALSTIFINFIVLCVVGTYIKNMLWDLEEDYIKEIVDNISTNITTTLQEYTVIADVLALNNNIAELMEQSTKANPMHKQPDISGVQADLLAVADEFKENVLNVAILDVDQDGYFLHTGGYSDDSFSFQTRPYYSAVTSQKSMLTSPYLDVETNQMVVSVASPVFGSSGTVLGVVLIDLSISFVQELVHNSNFGDSGASFVLDENNNILACHDNSYMGESYSALNLTGNDITSEISNPTGKLITYEMSDVERMGISGNIGTAGWKMVTSMSSQEFLWYSNMMLRLLLGMLAGSTVIIVVIAATTVKTSLKPIKVLEVAMDELSKGNIHYKFEYDADNEIGRLAETLRYTMKNLARYIDEIQELLKHCSHGDFTVHSDMVFLGDFVKIQDSIYDFTKMISQAMDGIKATVDQVSIGSDFVATGSQNLAEGSVKQADSVQSLNAHITDITENIHKNADNVKEVNKSAQMATSELQLSNEKMAEMLKSMEEIKRTSEGIQKIVKTIQDVAFQTNILALNAAVEAARAGQAGRGFAVVAEEVRNLSGRTSIAVNETTKLIEETTMAVGLGSSLADETASSLHSVTEDIASFIDKLKEITDASEEQASAIRLIQMSVTDITDVMQTNSVISQKSASTSHELSSQAAVMKETVEQFKT